MPWFLCTKKEIKFHHAYSLILLYKRAGQFHPSLLFCPAPLFGPAPLLGSPYLTNVVIERLLLVKVTNPPLQLHPVLALLTACTIYSLFSGSAAVRISTYRLLLGFCRCLRVRPAYLCTGDPRRARPTFVPATHAAPGFGRACRSEHFMPQWSIRKDIIWKISCYPG